MLLFFNFSRYHYEQIFEYFLERFLFQFYSQLNADDDPAPHSLRMRIRNTGSLSRILVQFMSSTYCYCTWKLRQASEVEIAQVGTTLKKEGQAWAMP